MASQRLTLFNRIKDSDIYFSFIKSPTAIVSSVILVIIFFCSFFVEFVAPFNPFDPSSLSLMEAFTPPSWSEKGVAKFILGTDGQGRDMLSTILYGSRISLIVGFSAILFSLILGVTLGLTAGYFGGKYEMIVMRLTDVQLTVPSILMALLVDGIARGIISREMHDVMAIYVLIFAIGISEWPQFARVSRAATLVEKNKDYVSASTIIGVSNILIMFKHILPNIMRPVLVIGTIGLALAIIAESTLSFLGVGVPPTTPSLGTLIRIGNDFLFSGEWWITFFPAIFLVLLAFSINLLGELDERHLESKIKLMSFLKIKNLSVDYKMRRETINAAKNVNIDVNKGEILGLVGESGSGKSTVGNAIINLIDEPGRVSNGSIVLDGIDIHADAQNIVKYRGKKIGLIFQDPQTSLNPILTIGDQLIETMQTHLNLSANDAKNKAINLLKEVGIKDAETRFNNYPHQFSGGMRQRVVISLALCCEPELLIADEPTTALDVSIQSQILDLIKKLTKERNLAVILITHDMGVIAETTDRVAVMKNGDLVEIGPTKELLTKPKEIYTKSLVSSVPPTNKKISRFKIIEKENKKQSDTNIKILNRWVKKEISDKDLVKVESLSKTFDDSFFTESSKNSVMAVNDVSFSIKEGQSFGLVGESGSGKSTIAKMIVNLFKPSSGDIYFNDVCITKIKSNKEMLKFRKQIQMIFQDPYSSLNGRLKVKDIVSEPIKLHNPSVTSKDLDDYIYDLLESVELTQQSAERYPHEFSGGQRQRISIARALATQPRLCWFVMNQLLL